MVTITIVDDALLESAETVSLSLGNLTSVNGAILGAPSAATLSIIDNEVPFGGTIAFSSATYAGAEGGAAVTITVTRTGGTDGAVSVDCTVGAPGDSATSPADYTVAANPTTLSWADGDGADKTFTITIVDDAVLEASESVSLALGNLVSITGAVLGAPSSATLTITDNDATGTLQFTAANYNVTEVAGATVTLTVTRSGGVGGAVTVDFDTTNGTANGADYTGQAGTLTWASGDGSAKTIVVALKNNDGQLEPTEFFNVILSAPTGGAALGAPSTATVTITDDPVN
jgi:hypothetical protein